MVAQTVDILTEALTLELHSALKYVVEQAWPSVIEDGDKADLQVLRDAWRKEERIVEEIGDAITKIDGDPVISIAYPLSLARLNFVRPRHIVSMVLPFMRDEIRAFETLRLRVSETDRRTGRLFDRLLGIKRHALTMSETTAEKARARIEAEAAGEEVEVGGGGDQDLEFPWRDPDMELADRMTAAEKGSLFDKIFAAMAQTDCTACGYDCEGYARAIADKEDTDLGKCVPGEDETESMLKKLMGV